ncbi:MAG: hypothetical protein LBL41_03165 [Bifidobacteriaceae bacterium]|jgi:hypothetical protein|nr:hypothetical protein [Bifidobacteriaceae bacterium]
MFTKMFDGLTSARLPTVREQINFCMQSGFLGLLLAVLCMFTQTLKPQIICAVVILGVSAIIDAMSTWLLDILNVFAVAMFVLIAFLSDFGDLERNALSEGVVLSSIAFILFYLLYLFDMYFFGDVKYATALSFVAGYISFNVWTEFVVLAILFTGVVACSVYVKVGKHGVFAAGPALFVALLVSLCVN